MAPSENTNLLENRVNNDMVWTNSPSGAGSQKTSFLVGLLGVLVGAALVSFSTAHRQNKNQLELDSYSLVNKHHHNYHHLKKDVVDTGNWIEDFSVSRGVLVESKIPPPKTLYASGQTAFNGTDLVGDDMGSQLAAAIGNVDQTLEMADMHKCDIVKLYVFVTSTDDVLEEWDQYESWLAECPVKPANTLVAIASLFRPDALIEIDVTAIH